MAVNSELLKPLHYLIMRHWEERLAKIGINQVGVTYKVGFTPLHPSSPNHQVENDWRSNVNSTVTLKPTKRRVTGFTPLENDPQLSLLHQSPAPRDEGWTMGSDGSIRVRGVRPRASSLTGFTLIEILVVIGAIAIFTTMAIVAFGAVRSRQRDVQRMANMDQLAKAMELYLNSNGKYPYTACGGSVVYSCDSSLLPFLPTIASFRDPSKPIAECKLIGFAAPCEYAFGPMSEDYYVVYFARERKLDPSDATLCYKLNPEGVSPCS